MTEKKRTKLYDYHQLSSGELQGEDGEGGPMFKATPFEGEGSRFMPGDSKAGAGRGKVNPDVVGKKAGGSVKGWGKARGARKAKMY